MKHTVYFEIYGKKMKTTVEANSEAQAKAVVKSKLKIHKVVAEGDNFGLAKDIMDFLTGFGNK